MSPLVERPKQLRSIRLPERRAVVAAETDVLVVGGGPAGLGAALGAADAGARVILAERYGFLGGNATAALVMPLMSYHTRRGDPPEAAAGPLMPTDHGPGEPVVAGALARLVGRMRQMGGAVGPSGETGYTVPFDPEVFKAAACDLLEEAGVELLFHAFASGVVEPPSTRAGGRPTRGPRAVLRDAGEDEGGEDAPRFDRIGGVIFETKSGPLVVHAGTIVDCTGDGDIAALAGAPYEMGREDDGLVQPMTLMFRMADFEQSRFDAYLEDEPSQFRGVHGLWELIRKATREGELDLSREDILLFAGVRPGELAVNSTRVKAVSGVDVFDLTRAEVAARRQMQDIVAFLRKRVPGFERSYLLQSGACVGVRETRRIAGEYRLEAADVMSARGFDDVVARCAYPIDIHDPTGAGTRLERVPAGEWYDIPLRCLLPKGVEGLLVAGRCISGSHEAHSSYRVMPVSMATGQAAGVCAAMASVTGRRAREVSASCVQAELIRQGAGLGDLRPAGLSCASCRCESCRVA